MQKERSSNARNTKQSMNVQNADMLAFKTESSFVGYETLETKSNVIGLFKDGKLVDKASGELVAVFDKTGFYAESGGQIGDIGTLTINEKNYAVTDTIKLPNQQHGLVIDMKNDELKTNDEVMLAVDEEFREDVKVTIPQLTFK